MKILKLTAGAILLLSFILPLSTCSGVVEEGSNREPEQVERYLISKDNTIVEWVLAVSFVFPFVIAAYTFAKSSSIASECLSVVSVLPAAYVLWWHSVAGVLSWVAYVLIVALLGYFIGSLICLTRNLNQTRGTKVPLR